MVETQDFENKIGYGFETTTKPMCVSTENTLALVENQPLINDVIGSAL